MKGASYEGFVLPAIMAAGGGTFEFGNRTGSDFTGVEDASMNSAFATTNFSTADHTGNAGPENLFRFTGLSNIPSTATIVDAYFLINVITGQAGAATMTFRRCLRAWVEAQATWNIFSTGNNWGTAGCQADGTDRVAAASCTASYPGGFGTAEIESSHDATLIADVQGIVNGSLSNNGWLMSTTDPGVTIGLPGNGTSGERPVLIVTYTN